MAKVFMRLRNDFCCFCMCVLRIQPVNNEFTLKTLKIIKNVINFDKDWSQAASVRELENPMNVVS